MTFSTCYQFLKSGEYLNAREWAKKHGKKRRGGAETQLKEKLGRLYKSRLKVEKLLKFQENTHYASLNIGGNGAVHYGSCCVLLKSSTLLKHATALLAIQYTRRLTRKATYA